MDTQILGLMAQEDPNQGWPYSPQMAVWPRVATSALSLHCNVDSPLHIRWGPNEMALGPRHDCGGHSDVPSCTDNQPLGH